MTQATHTWWQYVCKYGHFDCSHTEHGPCGDENNPPEPEDDEGSPTPTEPARDHTFAGVTVHSHTRLMSWRCSCEADGAIRFKHQAGAQLDWQLHAADERTILYRRYLATVYEDANEVGRLWFDTYVKARSFLEEAVSSLKLSNGLLAVRAQVATYEQTMAWDGDAVAVFSDQVAVVNFRLAAGAWRKVS